MSEQEVTSETAVAAAPVAPKSSRRKLLNVDLASDPQLDRAATLLNSLKHNMERMEISYALSELRPSPANPRRRSLDTAGVTRDRIVELAKTPRESKSEWLSRFEAFIDTVSEPKHKAVWDDLFDLTASIMKTGLLQPIVAKPDGEIIAGERRYTACLLAGLANERVIIRQMEDEVIHVARLVENLRRTDLTVADVCDGLRAFAVKVLSPDEPLSPDNDKVTATAIMDVMGCGQTQSYYYRSLCLLPDGDPMLARVLDGEFTGLRNAYEEVSAYLRKLKVSGEANTPGQDGATSPATKPGSRKSGQGAAGKAAGPSFKAVLPGTVSGQRIISALSAIDDLSDEVRGELQALSDGWVKLSDKLRVQRLAAAFNTVSESLHVLDVDDADYTGDK